MYMPNSGEKIPERYSISVATSEDAEQIRQLVHDSWIKTMSEALEVAPEQLEDQFKDAMTNEGLTRSQENLANPPEGRTTLVAKDGTKVIGVCTVQQRANEAGENELDVLHVLPGQTARGIGRSLWNTAEKSLDPVKDTFLWTTPGTKAVEVYERWGFHPVEYANEQLKTREPISRPRVKMVKKAQTSDTISK